MPRTNTVNEKWEIAPSLTNGVFCWVRRLWSQHISVTFSPPQPHLPRPLQFVGKRKKGLKSSKTNCGTIQKVLKQVDHTHLLILSFTSGEKWQILICRECLFCGSGVKKKEKDWSVLRQRVFIRQSNFLGTLTHPSGRGNTTMIIHNRPIRSNPEVIVHWKVNKHSISMNLSFIWREW